MFPSPSLFPPLLSASASPPPPCGIPLLGREACVVVAGGGGEACVVGGGGGDEWVVVGGGGGGACVVWVCGADVCVCEDVVGALAVVAAVEVVWGFAAACFL